MTDENQIKRFMIESENEYNFEKMNTTKRNVRITEDEYTFLAKYAAERAKNKTLPSVIKTELQELKPEIGSFELGYILHLSALYI